MNRSIIIQMMSGNLLKNKMKKQFFLISKYVSITFVLGIILCLGIVNPSMAEEDIDAEKMHADLINEDLFPSASKCKSCHEEIYREWSSSNHAYASLSPMFHKFENAINSLAPTINTFCVRCHATVSTQMGEARELPMWERKQVSREGITCITCHRVNTAYGKANGSRNVIVGDIFEPVYGVLGGDGVETVVENASEWQVATHADERGNKIHNEAKVFTQLSESEFCVSCHQVAVNLGIKLEVVWDQYRDSPAHAQGVSCQDCHMSYKPGVAGHFKVGPAAVVNGKAVNPDRIRHSHAFAGPGYPIAHPGIFPHNPDAENWTMEEWLQFNYRAPWGELDWEDEYEGKEWEEDEPEYPEGSDEWRRRRLKRRTSWRKTSTVRRRNARTTGSKRNTRTTDRSGRIKRRRRARKSRTEKVHTRVQERRRR